jgi:acyl-CoA hydrolase
MTAKPPSDSLTETVHVVLPNDANPLGFVLGGTVMHLVDIAGAVAALRHARVPVVTAAVDDLQFLHPIRVGDLMLLRARVNAAFRTSMEVEVEVFSEEALSGERQLTSRAYLTFVTVQKDGARQPVPPLLLESREDQKRAADAASRRAERLKRREGGTG